MRNRYPGLDLIRFGAALLVTLYHLGFYWWVHAFDPPGAALRAGLAPLALYVSSGWVGVPLFFTLSGFVIAFSAEGRTVKQFAASRLSRLYPAAWLCAPLTALFIVSDPLLWLKLANSLSLSPSGPWVSGVYWTLAVEVIFYCLVAVLIALRIPHALDRLGVGFAITGSAFWLLRVLDYGTGNHAKDVFAVVESPHGGLLLIDSAHHFGLGLILWATVKNGRNYSRLLLILACILAGVISTTASARFNISMSGEPWGRIVVAPMLYLLGVFAIVASVAYNHAISRFLVRYTQTVQILGLMTYPLYLVHSEMGAAIMRNSVFFGSACSLSIGLAGVLFTAALVLRLERHPRRAIRFAFGGKVATV